MDPLRRFNIYLLVVILMLLATFVMIQIAMNYAIGSVNDPVDGFRNYTEGMIDTTVTPILRPYPLKRPFVIKYTKRKRSSPHILLQRKSNALRPGFVLSKGRQNVQFVLGVPTEFRANSTAYLLRTLRSLISNMSDEDRNECLIVVCIGEVLRKNFIAIMRSLKQQFAEPLERGLMDVIAPAHNYYPDWKQLRINLNDTRERKQNLDCMLLMAYARSRGDYYLHLEDDVLAKSGYIDYIRKFIVLHNSFRWLTDEPKWLVMSFCELGFIGKLLATSELRGLLAFTKLFYNDHGIERLLNTYIKMKICNWIGVDSYVCSQRLSNYTLKSAESQFKRIYNQTELECKFQTENKQNINSPKAIKEYMRTKQSLLNAHWKASNTQYENDIYFWGYLPEVNGLTRSMLKHQKRLFRYRFYPSGNATNATLGKVTMVEVLTPVQFKKRYRKPTQQNTGIIIATLLNGAATAIRSSRLYTFIEYLDADQIMLYSGTYNYRRLISSASSPTHWTYRLLLLFVGLYPIL